MSASPRACLANPWTVQCAGKMRYDTIGKAQQALAHVPRKKRGRRSRMQAYHCGWCGFAHIGHSGRQ